MIKRIEAKNYRCLKYIARSLDAFHVLVGANATGKTTFFDVVNFLSDIVKSREIDDAFFNRIGGGGYFEEMTFGKLGGDIELAIELEIPMPIREKLWDKSIDTIRYEICLGKIETEYGIKDERVVLFNEEKNAESSNISDSFPLEYEAKKTLLNKKYKLNTSRQILRKNPGGNDNYNDETLEKGGKGWMQSYKLGVKRSALGYMPADEHKFPATTWLREFLLKGVQLFILDSLNIRKSSPPGLSNRFLTDGSNLPWVVDELKKNDRKFKRWIAHVRTALPDIEDIQVIEIAENRHKYLEVCYKGGIKVPSWLVSDGTLRLLALTLPAYLPDLSGLYLIEEPENGIHPKAIETVFQSLSSVRNAQILMATHSPVILSNAKPAQILCFAKTAQGVTDIVLGTEHPNLRKWQGEISLNVLYAGGVLG